jgi:cysteine desulfurase / selenocysteine lyase
MGMPDWNALRAEFPTLERWTYLDVARKAIPPRVAEQTMLEYCRDVYENAGVEAWSSESVERTRDVLARLLGAKPAEIAFLKNTTEGLNIAAHAFRLEPGDNVVLTDREHVNNVWVWRHWEKKGVELRFVANRNERLPLEAFLEEMDDRTRIVACAWVTYGNGYRVDLPALGRACRERGAKLVVDGVQGAGILADRLDQLGADLIAVGGHKGLLGLTGAGLLYCREELIREIAADFVRPLAVMGAAGNRQFDGVHDAHRFEGGNPSLLGLHVLRRTAEFIAGIGLEAIEGRIRHLSGHCIELAREAGLRVTTPGQWPERAHIVSVAVPDAARVRERLHARHRVVVNVKDGALRISMSFANNEEDLERAIDAIRAEVSGREARRSA